MPPSVPGELLYGHVAGPGLVQTGEPGRVARPPHRLQVWLQHMRDTGNDDAAIQR